MFQRLVAKSKPVVPVDPNNYVTRFQEKLITPATSSVAHWYRDTRQLKQFLSHAEPARISISDETALMTSPNILSKCLGPRYAQKWMDWWTVRKYRDSVSLWCLSALIVTRQRLKAVAIEKYDQWMDRIESISFIAFYARRGEALMQATYFQNEKEKRLESFNSSSNSVTVSGSGSGNGSGNGSSGKPPNGEDSSDSSKRHISITLRNAWRGFLVSIMNRLNVQRMASYLDHLTGYASIAGHKANVDICDRAYETARQSRRQAHLDYASSIEQRAQCQRDVQNLLQRKSMWQEAEVLRFADLSREELKNAEKEKQARAALDGADQAVDQAHEQLMAALRTRYHAEQVWSDKIRRASTYSTILLAVLQLITVVIVQWWMEPRRRERMRRMMEKVVQDQVTPIAESIPKLSIESTTVSPVNEVTLSERIVSQIMATILPHLTAVIRESVQESNVASVLVHPPSSTPTSNSVSPLITWRVHYWTIPIWHSYKIPLPLIERVDKQQFLNATLYGAIAGVILTWIRFSLDTL